MKLTKHVLYAIDDAQAGKLDAALLHACNAIDATAKRIYPTENQVRRRYVRCLRNYYWVLEPMMGAGINLVDTVFSNISLRSKKAPDFAEIIYEIFRCSHAHGDEVPDVYSLIQTIDPSLSHWSLGKGELHMPDRVVWALLAVSVFAECNARETSEGTYYLSLGDDRFLISEWWGREKDFRAVAEKYNQTRVKLAELHRLEEHSGGQVPAEKIDVVSILQPYITIN